MNLSQSSLKAFISDANQTDPVEKLEHTVINKFHAKRYF